MESIGQHREGDGEINKEKRNARGFTEEKMCTAKEV